MKVVRYIGFVMVSMLTSFQMRAQSEVGNFCTVNELVEQLFENDFERMQEINQTKNLLEQHTQSFILQKKSSQYKTTTSCDNYVIPIVFHVLHNNGPENVSDEQIKEQVRRLNLDFSASNEDTIDVVSAFKSIIGNANIEFRLAKIDPQGNATNGIVRYETEQGSDPPTWNNPWTENRQWPREKYMNVYMGKDVGENVAGFTQYPYWVDDFPEGDAIFMKYTYIGFDDRVLTHEVGHWLNLPHVWGSTNNPGEPENCDSDDGVDDTPNTKGWQTCLLAGESCGSLDNIQNYMEYTYCNHMFTIGQADRMEAALTSNIADRSNLWQEANLVATGVNDLSLVDFNATKKIICKGESTSFYDLSEYGVCSWSWQVDGSVESTSLESNPLFTFNTEGFFDATLSVSNNSNTLSEEKPNFILVIDPEYNILPYSESFENTITIPTEKWVSDEIVGQSWEINENVGATGNHSVYVNNFSATEEYKINLYSSTIDLSPLQNANLSFKVAYAQKEVTDKDLLRLWMSNDCGESWIIRWAKFGSVLATADPQSNGPFEPASEEEWKEYSVSIPSYHLDEKFMYRFEFTSKKGNNVYLDDINISGPYRNYPILNAPEDESVNINYNTVLLDWKSLDTASFYEYWIDTTTSFNSSEFLSGTTTFIANNPFNEDTEHQLNGLMTSTTYYWKVRAILGTDTLYWSDTWKFTTEDESTSIANIDLTEHITVYPNPMNEELNILFKNNTEDRIFQVQVLDALGNLMYQNQLTSNVHSLSTLGWSKGVYFVQVKNQHGKQRTLQKVVKF